MTACGGPGEDIGLEATVVTDRSSTSGYTPASAGARLMAVQVRLLNATESTLPITEANFFLEPTAGSSLTGHPSSARFADGCSGALAPRRSIDCAIGFEVPAGFVAVQIAYEHMGQRATAPISIGEGVDGGPDRMDGGWDAGPDGRDAGRDAGPPPPSSGLLDLLLMVDNSNSMTEEQVSLAEELPRLVRILVSGDFDENGDNTGPDDFPPFELNVGVVTADMGTGGFTVPTCARSDFGDDGILRTQGRTDITGCMATYPAFLAYRIGGGSSPAEYGRDVACVATVGTGGCGFEQQLETVLKALSPAAPTSWTGDRYVTPRFFRGEPGRGDGVNSRFSRDDSVLAIISLTDEEDCSALDPEIYNPSSAAYGTTDLNLRCFAHGAATLHPVSRYVDGFAQLRPFTQRIVYAPIVGIPVDLAPAAGSPVDYAPLISTDPGIRDARMQERIDPTMPSRLIPSCNVPGRGQAFPPIRIVQVAEQLEARGAHVTVQSVCQEDFQGPLLEIIRQIRAAGM